MNTSTASTGLRGLIATAIFGALASSFSAVSAADPSSSVSVTVKTANLNLSDRSGARSAGGDAGAPAIERLEPTRPPATQTSRWGRQGHPLGAARSPRDG